MRVGGMGRHMCAERAHVCCFCHCHLLLLPLLPLWQAAVKRPLLLLQPWQAVVNLL